LEETKALNNTLIIFTSDNGYFWGEHGLGDKRAAYEESIRIPIAARYPPMIKAGARIDQLVLNTDIAPTMLAAAGLPAHKQMQGRSFLPLLQGKPNGWREDFLCEYYMEQNFARVPSWEGVRTTRYKYIHYFDLKDMDELYDLSSDSGEMKNLIHEPRSKTVLESMRKLLGRYRKEIPA
jgi:N-acetylglucosamine-6-sulfatase